MIEAMEKLCEATSSSYTEWFKHVYDFHSYKPFFISTCIATKHFLTRRRRQDHLKQLLFVCYICRRFFIPKWNSSHKPIPREEHGNHDLVNWPGTNGFNWECCSFRPHHWLFLCLWFRLVKSRYVTYQNVLLVVIQAAIIISEIP